MPYTYNISDTEEKNILLDGCDATKFPFFQSSINSFRYSIFFLHRCLIMIYQEKYIFNKIIFTCMHKTKQLKVTVVYVNIIHTFLAACTNLCCTMCRCAQLSVE